MANTHPTSAMRVVDAGNGRVVRSWASEIDDKTIEQAKRTARSPVVAGTLALMPDAHLGIGSTVGSVIPTEAAIIPAAVGVDLGCGMTAVRTEHTASQLPDDLTACLDAVADAVPSGFASHNTPTREAEDWLARNPLPDDTTAAASKAKSRIAAQLGTLGGGNHFVELSLDETSRVWVVLHSGSRGVGNVLASAHIKEAKRICKHLGRELEDADLAYFVKGDEGFEPYVADMLWAQDYASENRNLMMKAVLAALRKAARLPFKAVDRVHCHHNYAQQETHNNKTLWVTRKGAIRAGVGERGVIPGSMGDDTYVVTGKGNVDSYESSAHGAGRRMSRTQARKTIKVADLQKAMRGRVWRTDRAQDLLDEAPESYKPIATVMSDQRDLVTVDHKLKAVLNYKGC